MKVTKFGAKIDWTQTLGSTGDISGLLPAAGEIVSATVTIDPDTLNVYMVWNLKSGSSYLIEYAVDLDLYKLLGVLGRFTSVLDPLKKQKKNIYV